MELVEGTCWSCGEETLVDIVLAICEPCTAQDAEEAMHYDDNLPG